MTLLEPPHQFDHGSDAKPHRSTLARIARSPIGIAVLGAAAVLLVDAGGTEDSAGVCVFRRCTGGYCPGCGLTRSARHVTRGEFGAAWNDHPWMLFALAQIAIGGVVFGLFASLRERFDWPKVARVAVAMNATVLVVVWIVRLVDGSIPRFF